METGKVPFEQLAADVPNAFVGGPFGSNLVSRDYRDSGIPVIRGQNLGHGRWIEGDFAFVSREKANSLSSNIARPGDIVFTQRGTLGQVALVPDGPWNEYIVSQSQMKATIDRNVGDPLFWYYYFSSPAEQNYIRSNATQTGVPHINLGFLRSHPVNIPPLAEQKRIAAILGSLDDKIEHNRRTARKLEELARAIFKAWFVDFEPVKAKAEGATSFPSMPQEVFDALPTTFVETEIGPVPEGWGVKAVGDLSGLSRDQIKPAEYPDEVFDHFSLPAFDAGRRPVHDLGGSIKSNKFIVKDGSVLLSKLNPRIPRVWLPSQARDRRQIASTEFLVFQPRKPAYRSYLYLLFSQDAFQHEMTQQATGTSTSHQRIKPKDLLRMKAVTGNLQVQNAFPALVNPILELVETGQKESDRLAVTRDYLLPRLISNKL